MHSKHGCDNVIQEDEPLLVTVTAQKECGPICNDQTTGATTLVFKNMIYQQAQQNITYKSKHVIEMNLT